MAKSNCVCTNLKLKWICKFPCWLTASRFGCTFLRVWNKQFSTSIDICLVTTKITPIVAVFFCASLWKTFCSYFVQQKSNSHVLVYVSRSKSSSSSPSFWLLFEGKRIKPSVPRRRFRRTRSNMRCTSTQKRPLGAATWRPLFNCLPRKMSMSGLLLTVEMILLLTFFSPF